MIIHTDIFFQIGILIGLSLIIGWWPSTSGGKILSLIGLSTLAWLVSANNPAQYIEVISACIFVLPAVLAMVIKNFLQNFESEDRKTIYLTKKPIEIVQIIDNYLNCVIGVNNVWVQNNWTKLTDSEKVDFIKKHRKIINKNLPLVKDTRDVIELLQKVSRGLVKYAE